MSQPEKTKFVPVPKEPEKTSEQWSGSATIYFEGDDSPRFGDLLEKWLKDIQSSHKIKIKNYNHNAYFVKGK